MNNINNFKKQAKSLELVCKDKNIINNNLSKVNFMKKSLNMKKGFTLIELLVVVAIIGTLTAIVLIGVNNGMQAGRTSAIQSSFDRLVIQLEIEKANNDYYPSSISTPGTSLASLRAKAIQNGATVNYTVNSASAATQFAIRDSGTSTWCIDSSGFRGKSSSASSGVCAL